METLSSSQKKEGLPQSQSESALINLLVKPFKSEKDFTCVVIQHAGQGDEVVDARLLDLAKVINAQLPKMAYIDICDRMREA